MLAANHKTVDNVTTTSHSINGTSDNDNHCDHPGNGCQDVENVDTDIPAKRKPAKVLRRIIVSRIIGILGLCVCVCVCVGGGRGGGMCVCECVWGEGGGWGRGGGVQC